MGSNDKPLVKNMFDHLRMVGKEDLVNLLDSSLKKAEDEGLKYILYSKHDGLLWRIMACKDFADVKRGDLGGIIPSEKNLSQKGDCWLYDDAYIIGDNALVYGDAQLRDNAHATMDAMVFGKAVLEDTAGIAEHARVYGDAHVHGNARVYGYAQVYGHAEIFGNVIMDGYSSACENARVYDDAVVSGMTMICRAANACMKARLVNEGVVVRDVFL